jgi:hypothetical protein
MNTEIIPASITEEVTLGQAITFDATLTRTKRGVERAWTEVKHEKRKGIIVGTRVLWDGQMHSEKLDDEDGGGYISFFVRCHMHINAFLVAFALNRKPVLVPVAAALAR